MSKFKKLPKARDAFSACRASSRFPVSTSRAFVMPSRSRVAMPREARLLSIFCSHPGVSFHTVELRAAVGVANLCGLLERMRSKYGLRFHSEMKPCIDRDGRVVSLAHYSIAAGADVAYARAVLSVLEGGAG